MSNGRRDAPEPGVAVPPMRAMEFILAASVRTLEEFLPGFTERLLENLQDHTTADEVIKLRGPRTAPEVLQEHAKAMALGAHIRLINIALAGELRTPEAEAEARPRKRKDKRRG